MKIAILEAGLAPPPIRDDFPSYPHMFDRLIRLSDAGLAFDTVSIVNGEDLPDPGRYDGYLITGSPAGVYDDISWMSPLLQFIQDTALRRRPMVGVCFGHQAIAEALGGKVLKSDKGWGLGRHTYQLHEHHEWMRDAGATFSLAVSHQDQVVVAPPEARLLGGSEFTPYAALYYPDAPALSFQGHPEFDNTFSAALYNVRRANPLSDADVDQAVSSLDSPEHNELVGAWIARFFRTHALHAATASETGQDRLHQHDGTQQKAE